MVTVSRSSLVSYSNQQMFDLINDIESYPEFMSGCIAAEVLSTNEHQVEARLTLGKKGIQQSFITQNELQSPELMIMRMVEGPFSHFEGRWQFQALREDACKVSLDLEFAFKNLFMGMTVGKWLEENASHQVDELCRRAETVYGKP
jgi:ribosome-associated toxin RatA of RatAB toxin-antitoxin module